jgi:hypothetical protein
VKGKRQSEQAEGNVELKLVWTGYEKLPDGTYSNEKVFPKWREKYPQPPDVIGVQRNYTYEIDRPSQKANQALVASIPQDHKQVSLAWSVVSLQCYASLPPAAAVHASCGVS